MLELMIVTFDMDLDTVKGGIYSKLGEKICFVQGTLPLYPFCNDSGCSKLIYGGNSSVMSGRVNFWIV